MDLCINTLVTDEDIESLLKQAAAQVEHPLLARLPLERAASPRLIEAMRYTLAAGGKRIRPALVLWSCEACGRNPSDALPAALAIECVHTFSLIHDDLPALDDDDLRRGKPSCHKQFDEATAILAGDALLALAFQIIAEDVADPDLARTLIAELAAAAGPLGLIGGEAADLDGQGRPPDQSLTQRIHAAKTARLIQAACKLGAFAARASQRQLDSLSRFGHALGMAFQAADDLLDVTAGPDQLGKPTGKDAQAGKQTYPRAVGVDRTREIAREWAASAVDALAPFGPAAARLTLLANFVVNREY